MAINELISGITSLTDSLGGGNGYSAGKMASFRGASFGATDVKDSRGRNAVIHEFPLRDDVWPEDMGRAPRRITVSGFVVGKDYKSKLKAIQNACEKEGPGTFVHPYTGAVNVVLTAPAEFAQSAMNRGMATFSLSFVEAPKEDKDGVSLFQPVLAALESAVAIVEACKNFDIAFFLGDAIGGALGTAIDWATDAVEFLSAVYETVMIFPAIVKDAAGFFGQVMELGGSIANLFEGFFPERNYKATGGGALAFVEAPKLLKLSLDSVPLSVSPTLGTARRIIAENKAALVDFQRDMSVIRGLEATAYAEPSSGDAARELRLLALKAMDFAAENATSDALFKSIQTLGNRALKALSEAGKMAPELRRVELLERGPTLPLIWRHVVGLTKPGTAAADMTARNRIRHPGFAPAGVYELLVKTDG